MNEAQWLANWDAGDMLDALARGGLAARTGPGEPPRVLAVAGAGERKMRLLAVAYCRQASWRIMDGRSRDAVGVAERFADGQATVKELGAARGAACDAACGHAAPSWVTAAAWATAETALTAAAGAAAMAPPGRASAHILRDTVGNPFRPATLRTASGALPHWYSANALDLAHAAYDSRDPQTGHLDTARLAVLADALEEAGCDDRAVLNHLRGLAPCAHDAGPCDDCGGTGWRPSPVPRYRGFWPLDLILGRE